MYISLVLKQLFRWFKLSIILSIAAVVLNELPFTLDFIFQCNTTQILNNLNILKMPNLLASIKIVRSYIDIKVIAWIHVWF